MMPAGQIDDRLIRSRVRHDRADKCDDDIDANLCRPDGSRFRRSISSSAHKTAPMSKLPEDQAKLAVPCADRDL